MISDHRNRYERFGWVVVSIVLGAGGVCLSAPQTNNFRHWQALDRQRAQEWRVNDRLPDDLDVPSDEDLSQRGRWLSDAMVAPVTNRPSSWAQPMELGGVPNMHTVGNSLFRSAQPSSLGMKNLKTMGIKTIVSLRAFHSDRDEIGETDLEYESIPVKAWFLRRKDIVLFLKVAGNPENAPVLVHCLRGSDRTGAMCAAYRIAVQGWTKDEAIREMLKGGYDFHQAWENIPSRIEKIDFEAIKQEAGIASEK